MQICGHKTEAVYRRYHIVAPQDLRLAGAKMERYLAEPKLTTPASRDSEHVFEAVENVGYSKDAGVAELADARDSKSRALHWA